MGLAAEIVSRASKQHPSPTVSPQAFVRGLLCNWLVCSAVWMASAASSLPGKMLAAYLPVMAFITLGLE